MLSDKIFDIKDEIEFEALALDIFQYQVRHCTLYGNWVKALRVNPDEVKSISQIPFLPIEFFKNHRIIDNTQQPEITFTSSATTSSVVSKHHVASAQLYEKSFYNSFYHFYGNPYEYCFLALLPSYLEREGSSLIYMINHFIRHSKYGKSGFFLYNHEDLIQQVKYCIEQNIPTVLIGVSFALLDFAEHFSIDLSKIIVMETGGMKGKRKEITRNELHQLLKTKFNCTEIHSEYGMTELLSQAYSKGNGIFQAPPWMKILISDVYEPTKILSGNDRGMINIIDLANIHSCAFIATSDIGKSGEANTFEVIGRMDNSDIRGCNLLLS